MSLKRDLDFIFEIGCIRYIDRTWKQFRMPDASNLAEHSFRVAWIALIIAKNEGILDTGKIVKLAIAHDIAESRTGDVNYMQREYTVRHEEEGVKDMLQETSLADEFIQLWLEAESKQTIEAKIIKDADNLDVDIELSELETIGYTVRKAWTEGRKTVYETKLYTETAKRLWEEIQKADPHDWHKNAKNRLNSGDWKKK